MQTLSIKVKPNAHVAGIEQQPDGTWLAKITAPPVDGKANEELIELIARHFKVRRWQVSIRSGANGRMKLVRVDA